MGMFVYVCEKMRNEGNEYVRESVCAILSHYVAKP